MSSANSDEESGRASRIRYGSRMPIRLLKPRPKTSGSLLVPVMESAAQEVVKPEQETSFNDLVASRPPLAQELVDEVIEKATKKLQGTELERIMAGLEMMSTLSPYDVDVVPILKKFREISAEVPPPPSSPIEVTTADQLSTATLPSLHEASVPKLIEHYRQQRRLNPLTFDQHTMAVKNSIIQAKLKRDGVSALDASDYTVELSSRLDAEAIERFTVVCQRRHVTCLESDDEDDGAYISPDSDGGFEDLVVINEDFDKEE